VTDEAPSPDPSDDPFCLGIS